MVAVHRDEWTGAEKTLLVSIDVGTTFTAASFTILEPGALPTFHEVLRWPKQNLGDAKVPSVVLYETGPLAKAFGAETTDEDILLQAEENQWLKAEWWKLHLRPAHLTVAEVSAIPPLPRGITVERIFADFLRYVKEQVAQYIQNSHGNGDQIWAVLYPTMMVVLTTPNGWEGAQQQTMRSAATKAGLVDTPGLHRIRFVSEAEAAILFAVDSGCISKWLERDIQITLCDCGGGTIDIASYKIIQIKPLILQETTIPQCTLTGAVFVTKAFENYLRGHLRGTEWADPDTIARCVSHFEQSAKRKFASTDEHSWVDLGTFGSNASLGVMRGRLKLSGDTMATFFAPSLESIKAGLMATYDQSQKKAKRVVLVGGLSSSPYVYQHLLDWGTKEGLLISRPDGPMFKAVANGALSWWIQNPVSARMSKFHWGVEVNAAYDPDVAEMRGRPTYYNRRGELRIENAWSCIIGKDTIVRSGEEFRQAYRVVWGDQANFIHTSDLLLYRGVTPPFFITDSDSSKLRPNFEIVCSVSADLQEAYLVAESHIGSQGRAYRDVSFEICVDFGETELSARIRWNNGGEHVYGPATISYLPLPPEIVEYPPPYIN